MVQDYGVSSTYIFPATTPLGTYVIRADARTNLSSQTPDATSANLTVIYGTAPAPGGVGTKVGTFSNGIWTLDMNGDGVYTAGLDQSVTYGTGVPGDIVVYGDWNGDGKTKIGVYNAGNWQLDYKGTGIFVGCGAPLDPTKDLCTNYGGVGIPVVGDWNGDGKTKIGVYNAGNWQLDYKGTGTFVGCGAPLDPTKDLCSSSYGRAGVPPVVGDWNGDGKTKIGVFNAGSWFLDYKGSGVWVGCGAPADPTKDMCAFNYGQAGITPVVGDWNGDGKTKIGVYNAGSWFLDYKGTGVWVGCGAPSDPTKDMCAFNYGRAGIPPVVGDWNGNGKAKIGVLNGGVWYLDYKGSGAWVGCGAPADPNKDACYTFGAVGGTPVVGKW